MAAPAPNKGSVVLVLDFGSQYTQLICRRVRELGVYSLMLPGDVSQARIEAACPTVVILSGGPNSVHAAGSPTVAAGFLDWAAATSVPVLGICYGFQLLVHALGGVVEPAAKREYGRMEVTTSPGQLYGDDGGAGGRQSVWMSHGDEAKRLPEGFTGAVVAFECPSRRLYGLQYHPEVTHTPGGAATLRRFLLATCACAPGWTMASVLEAQLAAVAAAVGPEDHAIAALSGGVDSAVAATLVARALGPRLHCVFVDNGLLRLDERVRCEAVFKEHLHLKVHVVDAAAETLAALKGVTDPEAKRKVIGAQFIAAFRAFAGTLEAQLGGVRPAVLVQGTLYPDVIESRPAPSADGSTPAGSGHSHTIKSHHNVGGLPRDLGFRLVEPLRELFKDEVRALGALMGVPTPFLRRHPFPGPGLAVRVLGDVTAEGALDTLRAVDEIFINKIVAAGLYDSIWQAFAVFLPIRTVGVQGDCRTHAHCVALRAVTSSDGMTADWYPFESAFLADVSAAICNQVPGVNRVVYDISSKPPATIEWE